MKRFIPLILLFASSAFGQTTVTGTCSVVVPATSLPVGMTFDGKTLTVPAISLTSGTIPPPGDVLGHFDIAGNLTWIPYVAPSGTNPALQAILSTPALSYTIAAYTVPIAGATVPAVSSSGVITGNTVTVAPIGLSTGLHLVKWEGYVSAPGIVTVFIDAHELPSPGAVPAMQWLVRLQ